MFQYFSLLPLILAVPQNGPNRSLNIALIANLKNVDDYGCWCHFKNSWTKTGKGKPVDIYDEECQKAMRGYECIRVDDVDENAQVTCYPYEIEYDEPLNIDHDSTDEALIQVCTDQNNHGVNAQCKIRSCIVESFFVRNIAALDQAGAEMQDQYRIENGFDFDANCGVNIVTGPGGKACCGSYPTRYPYQTRGGDYKCCHNQHVYNEVMFACCDNGSIDISCA